MGKVSRYPVDESKKRFFLLFIGMLCLLPATTGLVAAAFGWMPYDPFTFVGEPNQLPNATTWLGCDALGRDLFSRLGSAAAYFTPPGAVAVIVALVMGSLIGVAESLGGKLWGAISSWFLQVLDSLPKFVFVLLVASIARSNLFWIMSAVGVTFAPQIAAAIKSSVLKLRKAAFIEAERSLGVSMMRIVFVHILWGHARRVILAQLMSLMAYALLVETSLSYLGGELGLQEPLPSWGNMLALAKDGVFTGQLMPAILPALMISLTLLGFTLVGHGFLAMVEERM
ncbi:MAG: hypothetical protein C0608_06870 [Deltaproteobacteria bacterium]|nr:MAG: hypothetical protein C0608_06870 [Deltaproteobacteria bacterium]